MAILCWFFFLLNLLRLNANPKATKLCFILALICSRRGSGWTPGGISPWKGWGWTVTDSGRQGEPGQGALKAGPGLRFWCCLNPLFSGVPGVESGLNVVSQPYIQKYKIMKAGKSLQDDWVQSLTHVHKHHISMFFYHFQRWGFHRDGDSTAGFSFTLRNISYFCMLQNANQTHRTLMK